MIWSLLIVFLCFIYSFCCMRSVMTEIVDYLMNKSAIRKRKKGMTFKEWFCYSRFRTEIPKYHIIFYCSVIIVYTVLFLFMIFLHLTNIISDFTTIRIGIIICTCIFSFVYSTVFTGIQFRWQKLEYAKKVRGIDKKAYREKMRKLNHAKNKDNNKTDDE
ncbi:MAG: hypothetical protein HFJ99_03220 [Eubacterium sp.]|nr:hypothetical protein [Eubacterium sp.]